MRELELRLLPLVLSCEQLRPKPFQVNVLAPIIPQLMFWWNEVLVGGIEATARSFHREWVLKRQAPWVQQMTDAAETLAAFETMGLTPPEARGQQNLGIAFCFCFFVHVSQSALFLFSCARQQPNIPILPQEKKQK